MNIANDFDFRGLFFSYIFTLMDVSFLYYFCCSARTRSNSPSSKKGATRKNTIALPVSIVCLE